MRPAYFWQIPVHLMVLVVVAFVLFAAWRNIHKQ